MARVLVVDDDRTVREVVASYLGAYGHEVAEAGDGEQALRLVRERPADLVVLDLMLPGIDGLEVCRRLRARNDVPVIMLTALDTVTFAEVQVRSGPTWGRQVVIDATTSSTDPDEQLAVLDAVVHAGWDTAAFVPTDVSTVLTAPDGVALDARNLGFAHQGASPSGLFDRFGPPAADPGWRP